MDISIFQFYVILLFLASSALIIQTDCVGHDDEKEQKKKQVALFVFGDSLFDPGNNNYINTTTDFQSNFWPYGKSFFNYPTGRFSDGRLIPDFIAEYAKLPLIPTYLQPGHQDFAYGANFASAGAGALDETSSGLVINFRTQLSYFKKVEKQVRYKLGDRKAKQLVSNAVYLIGIGGNDYATLILTNSSAFPSYSQKEYIDIVIGNITAAIKDIYMMGGRKFGFVSLGPVGCLPILKLINGENGECMEELNTFAKLHNKELFENLIYLEKELKGLVYSNFNFYPVVMERMDNPSKYGFKDGKTACCGTGLYRGVPSCGGKREVEEFELCNNPSEYLFFDASHATEIGNQQYAELMWKGFPNVTGPYNLKSLFEMYIPTDNITT